MITGASQADAAILVVSARKGEFEDGTKSAGTGEGKYQNVIGMTTEHMLLLVSLGVTDIVVAVNKMDAINWDKARYDQVKSHVSKILTMLMKAVKIEDAEDRVSKIHFVPTSGLLGVNMIPKDQTIANLENHIKAATSGRADPEFIEGLQKELEEIQKQWPDWYDGPTLLDALDQLPSPGEKKAKLEKQSLRVPIQSSLNISGIGTVLTGRVASGVLKPGDKVVVAPTKQSNNPISIDVKSVQEFHKEIPAGTPGDNIGFNIKAKNLGAKDILKGAVVSSESDPAKVLTPNKDGFLAMVLVVRSLGKKGKAKDKEWTIHKEYAPVIHIGTAQVTCRVVEMKDLSGKDIESLKQNQRGMLWFTPVQPVVVEPLTKTSALGRFAMRDSGKTVAVGIVEKVEYGRYDK
jgi:elongation factor 1-alpha